MLDLFRKLICFPFSDNIVFLSDNSREKSWSPFLFVSTQQDKFFFLFSCLYTNKIGNLKLPK